MSTNIQRQQPPHNDHSIKLLVTRCLDENDVDKKIEMYYEIRRVLGYPKQLKLPSMITDDFINHVLQNSVD